MNRLYRLLQAILFLLVVFLMVAVPASAKPAVEAGAYRLSVTTDPPVVPAQGKATLLIRVTNRSGKPVAGMTVRALTKMPGMDMGEREGTASPAANEPGLYVVPATFAMAGGYESTVALSGPLGATTARLTLQTGEDTRQATTTTLPLPLFFGSLAAVVLFAFVLWRMRRTGQRVNFGAVANGQTVGALLLLAVVTGAAVYAVKNLRRPGALTPVDAQAMDMSYLPAPPGFVPVELATVSRGTVENRVRHTATAIGFTEQSVYSRITGTLVFMPLYAGNHVKQGQILARLDTSQTLPQQTERQAAVTQATQGVAVARAEQEQAQAAIRQAHAELSGKRGAVLEAQNNVQAAREAKTNAEAAQEAARTQIADAEAQVAATQAEAVFQNAQIERSATLFKAGAVSGEEFQRDKAQAQTADAKVRQAQAQVARMRAEARAQQAAVRQAAVQITAAEARAQITQLELAAYISRVTVAQAARNVARQKVGQAQSGVLQARASLASATANQGYAVIRAPFDGVVTARQIPPGTLVNPGQAILMLAQIDRVRIQASVAQSDVARVRVGTPVRIHLPDASGQTSVVARITSVVPAVDANARTGTVEATIANPGEKILPGQYVTMELTTGTRQAALRVPTRALVYRPVSGEVASDRTAPVVWVAETTGTAGQFTVRPVPVQIGIPGTDTTEIVAGLSENQRVVVTGATYLKDGDIVAEAAAPTGETGQMVLGAAKASSPATNPVVLVTERGFEPSSLSLKAGVPVRVTFTRKTNATCAKEIVFPDYGINKPLPLNTPVLVSFTPRKGAFTFACGMNMVKGKVVAQ